MWASANGELATALWSMPSTWEPPTPVIRPRVMEAEVGRLSQQLLQATRGALSLWQVVTLGWESVKTSATTGEFGCAPTPWPPGQSTLWTTSGPTHVSSN